MSLVSAILQEAAKTNMEDIKKHRDLLLPKLKDFEEKVKLLSWALQQNFIDYFCNFTPSKSLEQLNYKNRKSNIISEHFILVEEINIFLEKYSTKDDDFNSYYKKLNKSYKLFEDLCTVVEGKIVLDKANHEFGRYNYCGAILSVVKLQNQLKHLKFEGNTQKALENLVEQAENQIALYTAQLSIEWEDIFKWSENKSLHFLTYSLTVQQSDPELIQKVLKTLYQTERLNAELGVFSNFFIEKLLHNVLRYNCDIFTDDHIGALVFNIRINLNDAEKPTYQTIFNNLTAVFEFLHSTLGAQFDSDPKFIEIFADSVRQKFFHKIIEDCIRNNLPSCDSSYQNYKNIVAELDSFNKFLIDLKFVQAELSPLNQYITDTECVLYKKKCDKLLNDVRSMLSDSLSYGTITVGAIEPNSNDSSLDISEKDIFWDLSKPIFLPVCVVSQNVKKIMTLIVKHLEESAKLPDRYSTQLVSYIKDIAVMYQGVVPRKFRINLESCPLDIALFFNNCFYLAHGLMGPPWQVILPQNLADHLNIVLLECIQDLRVLGLEKMSLYLHNQKSTIIKNIEQKEPTLWTEESYESFDTSTNKAVNLMIDLKSSWYNVLPLRMYEMSLCTLVQALCQAMLDRIFADSRPISEEFVHMLAVKFEDATASINSLFEDCVKFATKVSSWDKFVRMPQLLRAQLLELSNNWNSKDDQLKGYTCEEIRQIVKMRFPDDKYRLRILKEIQ